MEASEKQEINAVCLRNAVLCADCEVIGDSTHEICRVCGSRSLLSLSRVLGTLPVQRAQLVDTWVSKPESPAFSLVRRMPKHTLAGHPHICYSELPKIHLCRRDQNSTAHSSDCNLDASR
jgi:hypothetical protein